MPICDSCGEAFDNGKKPGALLFSHPKTVRRASLVTKYHICQKCENAIVSKLKKKS